MQKKIDTLRYQPQKVYIRQKMLTLNGGHFFIDHTILIYETNVQLSSDNLGFNLNNFLSITIRSF